MEVPLSLVKGLSPIKLRALEAELKDYPRAVDGVYLLNGFRLGFHIPFQGSQVPFFTFLICKGAGGYCVRIDC